MKIMLLKINGCVAGVLSLHLRTQGRRSGIQSCSSLLPVLTYSLLSQTPLGSNFLIDIILICQLEHNYLASNPQPLLQMQRIEMLKEQ